MRREQQIAQQRGAKFKRFPHRKNNISGRNLSSPYYGISGRNVLAVLLTERVVDLYVRHDLHRLAV